MTIADCASLYSARIEMSKKRRFEMHFEVDRTENLEFPQSANKRESLLFDLRNRLWREHNRTAMHRTHVTHVTRETMAHNENVRIIFIICRPLSNRCSRSLAEPFTVVLNS